MTAVIQHNLVLHARIVVPADKLEAARYIILSQGWKYEQHGPLPVSHHRHDHTRWEIIASLPVTHVTSVSRVIAALQTELDTA